MTRHMESLGLVDEDTAYSMTGGDDWRRVSLAAAYRVRCEVCHAEGGPALQESGMLCVGGPQVGRFVCDRHYDQLGGPLLDAFDRDPFATDEEAADAARS